MKIEDEVPGVYFRMGEAKSECTGAQKQATLSALRLFSHSLARRPRTRTPSLVNPYATGAHGRNTRQQQGWEGCQKAEQQFLLEAARRQERMIKG